MRKAQRVQLDCKEIKDLLEPLDLLDQQVQQVPLDQRVQLDLLGQQDRRDQQEQPGLPVLLVRNQR